MTDPVVLYYAPITRASRPRWLLEELGVAYRLEHIDLKSGDQKQPSYLEVHPHGAVPALRDGDHVLIESAAICAYLADKHVDKGLAPPLSSPERGPYLQWLFYAMATLEPALIAVLDARKQEPPSEEKLEQAMARFQTCKRVLATALEDRDFLIGTFSAADIVVGSILIWAGSVKLLTDEPVLMDYAGRLKARPAYARMRRI